MTEATYLTPNEKRVQHVSEGSMAVLQIATLSSGSAILYFHSHEFTLVICANSAHSSRKLPIG